MDDLPEVLTRLSTRLETLESRVALLEHPSAARASIPAPAPIALQTTVPQAIELSSFAQAGATFAVLGKAMLGMAGAYVLRAVAESGSFPKLAAVALAIAYAGMWLVWAVRVPAGAWFASTTYAATSALILAPMVWELTLRFKVLSPSTAAAVLAAFVLAAYALAWKRDLASVVWVADVAAAIAAMALLTATHDIVPFVWVLLLMALLSELAADRDRWLSVRPLVAAAADLAVWALIFIYTSPDTSLADYPNLSIASLLAPACVLLLIYGTSVAVRTILLRHEITLFEAAQAIVAFLFAAEAILHFGRANDGKAFGVFCLLLAPACYAAVYLCFDGIAAPRNYRVYSLWSAALLLAGCFLCLNPLWLATLLGMAAILATYLGVRASRKVLELHGLVYLIAAAFASGLAGYAGHALAGDFPAPPIGMVWVICAAVVLCYAIEGEFKTAQWQQRLLQTISATLAVGALATLLLSALVWITSTVVAPSPFHVAVIRTLTGCALALALAFLGPRWDRTELVWVAYATLVLIALKLLLEDLRLGHPEFIAASIFLYAVTLMLVPRLARRASRPSPAPSSEI
jgi:hypothetical protein